MERVIELWTDGACSGNPGPGGWAYVIDRDGVMEEESGGEPQTTNNRMEMTAVIEGLRALERGCVRVITDSKYVEQPFTDRWIIGWERRGWARAPKNGIQQELKNTDLWKALAAEVKRHRSVVWRRVKGHSGYALNERCDELAVAACISAGGDPRRMVETRSPVRRVRVPKTEPAPLRIFNVSDLDEQERRRYGY